MDKPDYGIDAPGKIRTLTVLGATAAVAAWLTASLAGAVGLAGLVFVVVLVIAVACLVTAALMLTYARRGKFRHRDRMLALVAWRGDERVLDIGTGLGLLLVGAAKRLTTGRAIGLDIWSATDLSGNTRERTLRNLAIEGVADRCELIGEPAQSLSLPNESVDVVLSNLCLHNIPTAAERDQACRHIARVLKPGGSAVVSDFLHAGRYAECLRDQGLSAEVKGPYLADTFPPLRIVYARKPL